MSVIELRDRAMDIAGRYVGVREHGGNNRGPQIERFLASVGLGAGQPWCAAFVWHCYQEAAVGLRVPNPLPRTGKVVRMWQRSPSLWLSDRPTVGALFVHLRDPNDRDTPGHIGFVTALDGDRHVATLEGNTNAAGSRDGDGVYRKRRPLSYVHGYIDIGREGPALPPRTT